MFVYVHVFYVCVFCVLFHWIVCCGNNSLKRLWLHCSSKVCCIRHFREPHASFLELQNFTANDTDGHTVFVGYEHYNPGNYYVDLDKKRLPFLDFWHSPKFHFGFTHIGNHYYRVALLRHTEYGWVLVDFPTSHEGNGRCLCQKKAAFNLGGSALEVGKDAFLAHILM